VYDDLLRPTQRNHALSVETQVMAGLCYFASGSLQQVVGDVIGIDKSFVSRNMFVRFPRDAEKNERKETFYKLVGFPSCIGCIDGFHVHVLIKARRKNENDYINRKGRHSINVQGISGADNINLEVVV
jgi:hypothetical protein